MAQQGNYSHNAIIVKHGSSIISYPIVCIKYEKENQFRTMFFGQNPFNFIFPVFLVQIILAFFVSRGMYFLLRPLKQPKFVCNILAGIILGPSVLGRNEAFKKALFPDKELIILNTMATFGTTLFIFLMAIKTNIIMLLKTAKIAFTIGLSALIFPLVFTYAYHSMIKPKIAIFTGEIMPLLLCGSLASTYLPIIAHVLEEQMLESSELGQLSLASAMITETTSYIILFTGAIILRSLVLSSVIKGLIVAYFPIFIAFHVLRPLILKIVKKTPQGGRVKDIYVMLVFLGAFLMIILANLVWGIHLPMAFLMGLIVPDGPPLGSAIVQMSEHMVMEFFMPLFFVQVGYLSDIRSVTSMKDTFPFLSMLIVSYTAKMLGILLASLFFKIKLKNGLLLGTILNFKGVIDLTTYQRWRIREDLTVECYTILVLFNISFIALFSPLVKIFYDPQARLIPSIYKNTKSFRTLHSLLPQNVELRVLTCIHHEANVPGILNLLEALSCKNLQIGVCAYVINIVELVGQAIPVLAQCTSRKKMLKISNANHITKAFKNYSRDSNGLVSIMPFNLVASYKTMHTIICNLLEDKDIPFIVVPFHKDHDLLGLQKNLIRDFNTQLQAHAPCSVGILLERKIHSKNMLFSSGFSYKVLVFFVGGGDDREALSLALRMSNNSSVKITIIRIKSEGETEKNFPITGNVEDEMLIEEIKKRINNNSDDRVIFIEEIVNSSVHLMGLIKCMEQNYDLVIVGKNPIKLQFEKEMVQWVEYPELGVIGDMFACLEIFCDSEMSVLAVQSKKL